MMKSSAPAARRGLFPFFRIVLAFSLASGLTGCARLRPEAGGAALPPGAPDAAEILAGLAAQDRLLESFRAKASFVVSAPELGPGRRRFQGVIAFRRPDALYVKGRQPLAAATGFELTCVGPEYLLDLPLQGEYYHDVERISLPAVPFSVSPADLVREAFLPQTWDDETPMPARLVAFDPETGTATLELGWAWRPARRIVAQGPPWRLVRNERLDPRGRAYARAERGDFRQVGNVLFPGRLDVEFPALGARFVLSMSEVEVNVRLDEAYFDLAGRLAAVQGAAPPSP